MSLSQKSDYRKLIQASLVPENIHDAAGQLWRALPAVYRDRDNGDKDSPGDLRRFLQGFAQLLNQLRGTLYQRLDDVSPLTCQAWLLPYFADLLDVCLVSPDEAGRRREIAKAIAWRKRKGTVGAAVEIAEAVGQMPIIAFEGHRSVAATPRVGLRKSSMRELGEPDWPEHPNTPSHWAKRPGTPAVTVDFRKVSRPIQVHPAAPTPHSIKSRFGGEEIRWQHESAPHGIPPYLNGYPDIAMRTVDVRDANWEQGHHHPKRFRLYTPVPEGFVKAEPEWRIGPDALAALMTPMEPPDPQKEPPEEQKVNDPYLYWKRIKAKPVPLEAEQDGFRYVYIEEWRVKKGDAVSLRDSHIRSTLVTLPEKIDDTVQQPDWEKWPFLENEHQKEKADNDYFTNWAGYFDDKPDLFLIQWEQWFDPDNRRWHTRLRGGTWDMARGRPGKTGEPLDGREHIVQAPRRPTIGERIDIERPEADMAHEVQVGQLIFADMLCVTAEHCTVEKTAVNYFFMDEEARRLPRTNSRGPAELRLVDALVGHLSAFGIAVTAEYCTIDLTQSTRCRSFYASDCILLGNNANVAGRVMLRYCAVAGLDHPDSTTWKVHAPSVHTRLPELYGQMIRPDGYRGLDPSKFGTRGFGVIHQASHGTIRHGAEDGGELGAYHHRRYCGRQDAVVEKLKAFLPVGTIPVLIVDPVWPPPITCRPKEERK